MSDKIVFADSDVSTEFNMTINNLSSGSYYWRAYAINFEGTGYGDIKSFTIIESIKIPFKIGDIQIGKVFLGSTDIGDFYFNNVQ